MKRYTQVVVIGNSRANDISKEIAYHTGKIIGKSKALLITGGRGGVMEEASRGAKEENGMVLSIIPDTELNNANEYSDFVVPSGIGYARNMTNVLSGDLIVAIGGAAGTLSEISYAWQFNRQIFAYTNGGWSKIVAEKGSIDDRYPQDKIIPIHSVEDFEEKYLHWLKHFKKK